MAPFQVLAFVHSLSLSSLPVGSPVTSRSECISICYFDVKCSSFFFDSSSNMCHPSQSVYAESEAVIPSTGLQYFVWSAGMCNSGYVWSRYLNLCYKVYNTLKTWDGAESQCISDGGHLISVKNQGVNNLVVDLVDSTGESLWIGGHAYGLFTTTWEWRDGSVVQFESWGSSQGDGGLVEPCMFVDKGEKKWHDASVYAESEAVIPSTGLQYFVWSAGMCNSGYVWSRYLNLCYKVYNTLKTWDGAESQCISDGGHLISVKNQGVNNLVVDLVDSTGESLWIGGHAYRLFTTTWEWRDGSVVQFESWGSSQGDGGLVEPCMFVDKGEKKWHDAVCLLFINYLCEHPHPTLHQC